MGPTLTVAKREFQTFFNSPVAYIVLGVFLLVGGWLYFSTLFLIGNASLRGFLTLAPVLFVVFAPAVTMRSFAEERKSGTIELLLTLPLGDWEVVMGKFLGALGMVAVGLLFTVPYAISVSTITLPGIGFDWGPVIAGYIALLLMASSFLSFGLWASVLSKNQIVGFIVGLTICFALYFVDKFGFLFPGSVSEVLRFLSVDVHFENIARGVLDTRDLLFYITLTAGGLVLTRQSLGSVRQ